VLAAAGVGALLALSAWRCRCCYTIAADPTCSAPQAAHRSVRCSRTAGASLWLNAAAGRCRRRCCRARAPALAAKATPGALILTGAMLAAVSGALATLLLTITPDERLRGAIFWLVGDLSGAQHGAACVGAAAVFALALWLRRRSVDRLLLGAEAAALLGEPVRRLRYELPVAASLAAGWPATARRDRLRRPRRAATAAPRGRAAHARAGVDEPGRRCGAARRRRPCRAHAGDAARAASGRGDGADRRAALHRLPDP
jgi:hypothetical protein